MSSKLLSTSMTLADMNKHSGSDIGYCPYMQINSSPDTYKTFTESMLSQEKTTTEENSTIPPSLPNGGFILNYRIEDNRNSDPPSSGSSANISSTWINGNTINGTEVGSGNYNNDNIAKFGLYGITPNGTTVTFKEKLPNTIDSGSPIQYLYVRIGSQNNVNFKITNVIAQLIS